MSATEFSHRSRLALEEIFGSKEASTESLINLYKELYGLPTFTRTYEVTPVLFNYCQTKEFFVNMVALHGDKVFLGRSLGHELGWLLPGSSVRSRDVERFEDAVSRILARDIPKIDMVELQPIAVLEKKYHYDGDEVLHRGLSFISRVRRPSPSEIHRNDDIKGRFVSIFDEEELNRLNDFEKRLIVTARSYVKHRTPGQEEMVDQEIDSTRSISHAGHKIHTIIKPIFKPFSSGKIKAKILSYIKSEYSVLDVACGDDDFIFELAKKCKLCVGNDIEWNQVKERKGPSIDRPSNLIFFNHDARHLPFRQRFDFTLCKNLLHHMTATEDVVGLLRSLRKVSKRILIVDPENPRTTTRGKIWNIYYRKVLDDQGQKFFNRDAFETTLRDYFNGDKIEFHYERTIKGNYMFTYVEIADSPRPEIKGIIFDLDGLLVDTEPLFFQATNLALLKLGIDLEEKEYIKRDLQNGSSVLAYLQSIGKLQDATTVQEIVYENYADILKKGVRPMAGAINAVRQLAAKYPLAIASSSKREFINLILKQLHLEECFQAIVAREDVQQVKPDPQCLHLASSKLGIAPGNCLLVEDSQRGIKAGRAAGMLTIVIPNRMTEGSLQLLHEISLNSLEELNVDFVLKLSEKNIL